MAVGLVQAEHERARDPRALLDPQEAVEVAGHPVDVGAEMDVRVEDLDVRRGSSARTTSSKLSRSDLRAGEHVLHQAPESTDSQGRLRLAAAATFARR